MRITTWKDRDGRIRATARVSTITLKIRRNMAESVNIAAQERFNTTATMVEAGVTVTDTPTYMIGYVQA